MFFSLLSFLSKYFHLKNLFYFYFLFIFIFIFFKMESFGNSLKKHRTSPIVWLEKTSLVLFYFFFNFFFFFLDSSSLLSSFFSLLFSLLFLSLTPFKKKKNIKYCNKFLLLLLLLYYFNIFLEEDGSVQTIPIGGRDKFCDYILHNIVEDENFDEKSRFINININDNKYKE